MIPTFEYRDPILVRHRNFAFSICEWNKEEQMYIAIKDFPNNPDKAIEEYREYAEARRICKQCGDPYQMKNGKSQYFCWNDCGLEYAEAEIKREAEEE